MKNDYTHVVIAETPYYETSPQQGRPPDGTLSIGERVRLIENDSNYPRVEMENGKTANVEAGSLKAIERESK